MLAETLYDIDEFIKKIDPAQNVHYEIESRITGIGDTGIVKLILYGVGSKTLLKCIIAESARWNDEEVRKHSTRNAIDDLKLWIAEKRKEFEKKAKELNATPGRYEVLKWQ